MEPNFEEIKKMCYSNGALRALNEMRQELKKKDNYTYLRHSIEDTYFQLIGKYSSKNLISGDELDEAQQKSE